MTSREHARRLMLILLTSEGRPSARPRMIGCCDGNRPGPRAGVAKESGGPETWRSPGRRASAASRSGGCGPPSRRWGPRPARRRDLTSTSSLWGCVPRVQGAVNDGEAGPPGGHQADRWSGYPGGRPGPLARRQPRAPALNHASLRGPEPWPATARTPPSQMQRVRSNTRLGTLIVTTVPVTALGVVVGMGVGASLVVCGPVAVVLGLTLGAALAAGIAPAPEPVAASRAASACARCWPGRRTRRARRSRASTCASTSRRPGCEPWATPNACTAPWPTSSSTPRAAPRRAAW